MVSDLVLGCLEGGVEAKPLFSSEEERILFNEQFAYDIGRQRYIAGYSYDPMGRFSESLTPAERNEREMALWNSRFKNN